MQTHIYMCVYMYVYVYIYAFERGQHSLSDIFLPAMYKSKWLLFLKISLQWRHFTYGFSSHLSNTLLAIKISAKFPLNNELRWTLDTQAKKKTEFFQFDQENMLGF